MEGASGSWELEAPVVRAARGGGCARLRKAPIKNKETPQASAGACALCLLRPGALYEQAQRPNHTRINLEGERAARSEP